jgi:glycosyltransferase involved in cell wall biosynthesis
MKHIIIDARLYGPTHTGIGRYTKNLLIALSQHPEFNNYKFTLIVYKNLIDQIKKDLSNKYKYVPTNIHHYSISEQLFLPFILYALKPDIVHFTHFNKPIFYFGKSVVTIHDLIKHFFKGKETTTKSAIFYWLKHAAYVLLVNIVIKTSTIIVPSNYWRDFLIKSYKVLPQNVITTHEAVDPNFFVVNQKPIENPKNYILYTGNLYPHKNVKIILEALKELPDLRLKVICARNFFTDKLMITVKDMGLNKQVEFLGYVTDEEFKTIYSEALALVHPSFMEGFSLTGLEAMALNCPVISSNSSCLPEIYQKSVLYFDPNKKEELVSQIKKLMTDKNLRKKMIDLGHQQLKKYSWSKTASETLKVYQNRLK